MRASQRETAKTFPSCETATSHNSGIADTVWVILSELVSNIETLPSLKFAINNLLSSLVNANLSGRLPYGLLLTPLISMMFVI